MGWFFYALERSDAIHKTLLKQTVSYKELLKINIGHEPKFVWKALE